MPHICRPRQLFQLCSALVPSLHSDKIAAVRVVHFLHLSRWLAHVPGGEKAPPRTGVLSVIVVLSEYRASTDWLIALFSFFFIFFPRTLIFSSSLSITSVFFRPIAFLGSFPGFFVGVCENCRSTVRNWRKFQSPDPEGRKVITKIKSTTTFSLYLGRSSRIKNKEADQKYPISQSRRGKTHHHL